MTYFPKPVSDPVDARIMDLAMRASEGRLVVCAGAGLSKASPTDLPLGNALAEVVHRLLERALGVDAVAGAVATDLLSVADAVERVDGGAAFLQSALLQSAEFTTADPNFGHSVLALLVIERAVEAVVTNWDDCIERGAGGFGHQVRAIVSDADLAHATRPLVMKVHGCARQEGSLLVSSTQLANPPTWVEHHLGARLGDSTVVFVGLGDVPKYVAIRIGQLLDVIGDHHRVWVVSRDLSAGWADLLPDADQRFLELTADEFLDELIRGYVKRAFLALLRRVEQHAEEETYADLGVDIVDGTRSLLNNLEQLDGKSALSLFRSWTYRWGASDRFAQSAEADVLFLALALLSSCWSPSLIDRRLRLGGAPIEVIVARGRPVAQVLREGVSRVERARAGGDIRLGETPVLLVHGHEGPLPNEMPFTVVPGDDATSIIGASQAANVGLVAAQDITFGRMPMEWVA